MASVTVALLSLAAPPGHLAETRQRSEDALRLAVPSGDCLLLLRRLDLGVLLVRSAPAQWEARAATLIREQRARAVHGSQPGAEASTAVWFRSAEEARTLLLLALLSGRPVCAWFWRLAVPGWKGFAPRLWLERLLAEAWLDPPLLAAVARSVVGTIAAQRGHALLDLLKTVPVPNISPGQARRTRAAAANRTIQPARHIEPQRARAALIIGRLESTVQAFVMQTVQDRSVPASAQTWLTRLVLVAGRPELAAFRETLCELADALAAIEAAPSKPKRDPALPMAHGMRKEARYDRPEPVQPAARKAAGRPPVPEPDNLMPHGVDKSTEDNAATVMEVEPAAFEVARPAELASAGAGLFLLVRPLFRLGIGTYCERAPIGFGHTLLRHMAERMRVPADDPLFCVLGDGGEDQDPAVLTAWRIGTDRWLRRHTGRKLAQVVGRRGWIMRHDEGVNIRFRLDDADVELRRRALDLDPGWVGWLGMTIRFHYRDEPLE